MQHKSENKKETHSPIALGGLLAESDGDGRDSTEPADVESKNYFVTFLFLTILIIAHPMNIPSHNLCIVGTNGGIKHQEVLKGRKIVSNQPYHASGCIATIYNALQNLNILP